jgi:hypothetical protein
MIKGGGDRVSVLGQPQHDWDEFLEDAAKPKRGWRHSRVLWIAIPAVIVAAIIVYYYAA